MFIKLLHFGLCCDENNEHNYGTYQKLRNITEDNVKIKYEIPVLCKMQGEALCENRFTISFEHKNRIEHYLVI